MIATDTFAPAAAVIALDNATVRLPTADVVSEPPENADAGKEERANVPVAVAVTVHDDAPAAELYPDSQAVQDVEPVDENVPAGQTVHADSFPALKRPAAQCANDALAVALAVAEPEAVGIAVALAVAVAEPVGRADREPVALAVALAVAVMDASTRVAVALAVAVAEPVLLAVALPVALAVAVAVAGAALPVALPVALAVAVLVAMACPTHAPAVTATFAPAASTTWTNVAFVDGDALDHTVGCVATHTVHAVCVVVHGGVSGNAAVRAAESETMAESVVSVATVGVASTTLAHDEEIGMSATRSPVPTAPLSVSVRGDPVATVPKALPATEILGTPDVVPAVNVTSVAGNERNCAAL